MAAGHGDDGPAGLAASTRDWGKRVSERLIDINGARLWVASSGLGTPVMLSNGGPGCCDYLAPVTAMIDDRALVHRWEQRGCGRSSADGPFDLETTARP